MKEITRVHLAKTPFDVEVDAKKALEQYLLDIEKTMKAEAEAMREIEARMVELLAGRGVHENGVITTVDVEALREQLGEPSVFSDTETVVETVWQEKPDKRLMRDEDRAVFGGVCAGVASYVGIDPLWVRILAIILIFMTMGSAILVYLLMWLILPPARTSAEKLTMRGEAVNFETLKKFSLDEENSKRVISTGAKIGRIVIGLGFAAVALGALIATLVGGVMGWSVVHWMKDFGAQPWAWGLLISLIVGGIVLTGLTTLLSHSAFTWRMSKSVGVTMVSLLIVGAFSVSSVTLFGMQTGQELSRDEQRMTRVVPIELPKDLDGVKYAESTSSQLEFDARGSSIRAELSYVAIDASHQPTVTVNRDGDTLQFYIEEPSRRYCPAPTFMLGFSMADCNYMRHSIKLYGPLTQKIYTDSSESGQDSV